MNIPCKNCITLAVCKQRAIDFKKRTVSVNSLLINCSIFRDYCKKQGYIDGVEWTLSGNYSAFIAVVNCFIRKNEGPIIETWTGEPYSHEYTM